MQQGLENGAFQDEGHTQEQSRGMGLNWVAKLNTQNFKVKFQP